MFTLWCERGIGPVGAWIPAQKCKKNAQKENELTVQETAEKLFFTDPKISQCFDTIVAVFSTHHFVDPHDIYQEIFPYLRPSGPFV